MRKALSNYTTTYRGGIQVNWKLYNTVIVVIQNNEILLNSGGYKTRHTKNCINDILPSGYKLFQKDFEWFVELYETNTTIPFTDNMTITV